MRTLADLTRVRAVLSVPLTEETGADGGAFGVLSAYSMSPRRWSGTDTEVLEALAQLATSFLLFSRAVHQQGARVDGERHLGDFCTSELMLRERLPERATLSDIKNGLA